jgi:hypothetical protein
MKIVLPTLQSGVSAVEKRDICLSTVLRSRISKHLRGIAAIKANTIWEGEPCIL